MLRFAAIVALALQAAAGPVDTPHLTLRTSGGTAPAAPGRRVALAVDITPKAKMHVYAPRQKELIPISLTLDPSPAFHAAPAVYPKPETYFFAPLKETQFVYSRPFRIVQDVTIAPAAALRKAGHAPGAPVTVTGTLRYQACDDAICYLPKSVPVSWTIALDPGAMK